MGAIASKLSGAESKTGKELQLNSKEISDMSNELFKFMYSTWKPKDVWDIAENPDKYVIAISDMITTQFHVLGYKTRDKRMGEIYFRKWDDLEPPMGSETSMSSANLRNDRSLANIRDEVVSKKLKKEIDNRKKTRRQRAQAGYVIQKQNAEIIAFYFVRIFQILGAMLLVIKDVELPSYDENTGEEIVGKHDNASRAYAQQLYPSQLAVPSFKPPSLSIDNQRKLEYAEAAARETSSRLRELEQKKVQAKSVEVQTQGGGGNFDQRIALGPYEFLRYYLRTVSASDILDFKANNISIDNRAYMFDKARLLFFRYTPPGTGSPDKINASIGGKQEFGLPVSEYGKSGSEIKYISVTIKEINFSRASDGTIVHEIEKYGAPGERKDKKETYPTSLVLEFEHPPNVASKVTFTRLDKLPSSFSSGVGYQITSADNNLLDVYKGEFNPVENFTEILEKIAFFYMRKKDNNLVLAPLKNKTVEHNDDNHNNNSQKFKLNEPSNPPLKEVFNVLNPKKSNFGEYRPHCVARALQLLDIASINNFNGGVAKSGVCKTSLGKAAGTTSLSEYIPTKSIGQLYGKINPTDYTNSMNVLKAFVQKTSDGLPLGLDDVSKIPGEKDDLLSALKRLSEAFKVTFENQKSFGEIKLDTPIECKGDKGKTIDIDRGSQVFRDMKATSQQLLAYHLKHIVEISKFLKKIFNINQKSSGWVVEGPKTELLFAGFETLDTITNQARTILIEYYAGCEKIYQTGLENWKKTREVVADNSKKQEGVVLASAPKPAPAPAPLASPVPAAVPSKPVI